MEETNTLKHSLENERKCLYGKIKRCRNADSKALLRQDVETMTAQIKSLRKEVVLYERIKKRSEDMKAKIKYHSEQEKKNVKESHEKNPIIR